MATIYDAIRTPFGKHGKAYAQVRPDDLAAAVLSGLAARNTDLDPSGIDEVVLGAANQAGEDNRNVARMASLLAGWPTGVPGVTVNRLCGSGVEAVIQASRQIDSSDAQIVIAGGVESMTRAPFVLPKSDRPYPATDATIFSTTLGWRMVNPKMDNRWTVSLGETAEILAEKFEINREAQDAFAARSHRLAASAWAEGRFANEIIQIAGVNLEMDESIRPDTTAQSLAHLKPVFRQTNGTVTAGNASPLSDGASALLIGSDDLKHFGEPLARITGRASVANDPNLFGIAPVEAANQALARAGRSWADVDFLEINEAFASQVLACIKLWPELDPEKVNVDGGAIAIGHPLGASGGRIIGHLAHTLKNRGGKVGVAAICVGVGQGLAVVIERD